MSFVKRLGVVAVAAGLGIAMLAPTGAEARHGRIAEGAVVADEVGGILLGTLSAVLSLLSFWFLRRSGGVARPILGTLRVWLPSSGGLDRSPLAPRAGL